MEPQDRPLKTWVPLTDEYCEEALRKEGRGLPRVYRRCAGVKCIDPKKECPNRDCTGEAAFRCGDGACIGEVMRCERCIVAVHAQLPTHFVEVRKNIGRKRNADNVQM